MRSVSRGNGRTHLCIDTANAHTSTQSLSFLSPPPRINPPLLRRLLRRRSHLLLLRLLWRVATLLLLRWRILPSRRLLRWRPLLRRPLLLLPLLLLPLLRVLLLREHGLLLLLLLLLLLPLLLLPTLLRRLLPVAAWALLLLPLLLLPLLRVLLLLLPLRPSRPRPPHRLSLPVPLGLLLHSHLLLLRGERRCRGSGVRLRDGRQARDRVSKHLELHLAAEQLDQHRLVRCQQRTKLRLVVRHN